jgi:DNA polymerase-4
MKKTYKVIFHVDLNAFFASCEMAEDPALKNVPLGIGGNHERGVLTTANYPARKYGVHSAMSVVEAKRKCPHLVILPGRHDLYQRYSEQFFDVLYEYTHKIEKGSIDEGYMDVTHHVDHTHPIELAKEIQQRLLDELDLPVSIGIAPNMFLAKMASDMKKPLGITVLRKRDVKMKLWPLPIEKMMGIGKKTYPDLKRIGIQTIGDLVHYEDRHKLSIVLGNQIDYFVDRAHGIDHREVDPARYIEMKSIGHSETYLKNLQTYQACMDHLYQLTKKVVKRLEKDQSIAKTVTIQVRYNDFNQITRSHTLEHHTNLFYDIYAVVERLYDENHTERPVRLLGVSVSGLIDASERIDQLSIYDVNEALTKEEHVRKVISGINALYGQDLLHKGVQDDNTKDD